MMPAKERATMHRHSRHQPATTNNTTTTTLAAAAAAAAPATYDSSDYLQPIASHSHRSTTTTNRHRDACGSSRPRRGLRSGSSSRSARALQHGSSCSKSLARCWPGIDYKIKRLVYTNSNSNSRSHPCLP